MKMYSQQYFQNTEKKLVVLFYISENNFYIVKKIASSGKRLYSTCM